MFGAKCWVDWKRDLRELKRQFLEDLVAPVVAERMSQEHFDQWVAELKTGTRWFRPPEVT
jgi:hypothetical protein